MSGGVVSSSGSFVDGFFSFWRGFSLEFLDKPRVAATGILGAINAVSNVNSSVDWADSWTVSHKLRWLAIVIPLPQGPLPMGIGSLGSGPPGASSSQYLVLGVVSYGLPRSVGIVLKNPPTFTPQANADNIWKITLPPKVIANVRARLKKFDEKRKKAAGKKKAG